MVAIEIDEISIEQGPPPVAWGWYLGAGIAWIFIGLSILSWNPTTIGLISILVGTVVLLAGVLEILNAFAAPGWRWLHLLTGAVFVVAGVLAFLHPFRTFVGMAMIFGWYLVIKGMSVMVVSLAMRMPGSLWGLGVAVGLMNFAIGLWAIGYPGRSAWLLVLWIGIGAVLHGVSDIVTAFMTRSMR